jgi:hypothetical protein
MAIITQNSVLSTRNSRFYKLTRFFVKFLLFSRFVCILHTQAAYKYEKEAVSAGKRSFSAGKKRTGNPVRPVCQKSLWDFLGPQPLTP